ncbi:MAG TPA: hypothetical protein VE844_06960, partial [Gammaproteobacteria bacterium]|nr:hypothetical protein [Gammaproteobacteria bacterium]
AHAADGPERAEPSVSALGNEDLCGRQPNRPQLMRLSLGVSKERRFRVSSPAEENKAHEAG